MTPSEEARYRGWIMFLVGLGLFIQEALRHELERPIFIGAYLVMMGITTVIPGLGRDGGNQDSDKEG